MAVSRRTSGCSSPSRPARAGLPGVEIAVCVPFPYLQQAAGVLRGGDSASHWGAQNLSEHDAGAYHRGSVGRDAARARLPLRDRRALGAPARCTASATRRSRRSSRAAQRVGLVPILCVGETLAEREQGATEEVVGRQLQAVVDGRGRRRRSPTRSSRTSRYGRSAPAGRRARAGAGRARVHPGARRGGRRGRRRSGCRCCTAAA